MPGPKATIPPNMSQNFLIGDENGHADRRVDEQMDGHVHELTSALSTSHRELSGRALAEPSKRVQKYEFVVPLNEFSQFSFFNSIRTTSRAFTGFPQRVS